MATPEETGASQDPAAQDQNTPAPRPAPEYGEYAPEGWSWTPPGEESETDGDAPAAQAAGSTPASTPGSTPNVGPIPGVPHNLGAAGSGPSGSSAPASTAGAPGDSEPRQVHDAPTGQRSVDGAPAAPPSGASDAAPYRATAAPVPQSERAPRSGGRVADRVVTVVLLAIGAYGALSTAAGLFTLEQEFTRLAAVFDLSSASMPNWVGVMCTVGGLAVLAIYAVTLIFSIQRLRAQKLAFYIPLIAGVIAAVLMMVVAMVAMFAMPGLMEQMSDPSAMDKILEYAATTG